jgi:fimbrial chaperone protein
MRKKFSKSLITETLFASLLGGGILISSFPAWSGGVALGATRLIYPQGQNEISISMNNTDKKSAFLIQSWVTDSSDKKSSYFITTPPLFVIKPGAENTLRLMYAGPELPIDKESVFYLHSKAIPSVNPDDVKGQNVLQIAVESVIKVLWRPKGLQGMPRDAPKALRCSISGEAVVLTNPTSYYTSLIEVYVGNNKFPNQMVSPKGKSEIPLSGKPGGIVTFKAVNDYGAATNKIICPAG